MVLRPTNGLSLCAGGAGLDMGLMLAEPGYHTRIFVEWEGYPRSVLQAGMRAGYLADAPIWDDVTTFNGHPYRAIIDTVIAGYPCQPFSAAGQRKGADDERHLWPDVARIIREIQPRWVMFENVSGHVSLGAETVLRELWGMGLTPAAGLFTAAEIGAPHRRERWFCVAHRQSNYGRGELRAGSARGWRSGPPRGGAELEHAPRHDGRLHPRSGRAGGSIFPPGPSDIDAWASVLAGPLGDHAPAMAVDEIITWAQNRNPAVQSAAPATAEPTFRRVADGLAARSRALRLLGNGVVPLVAGHAWRSLSAAHGLRPVDLAAAGGSAAAGAGGDGFLGDGR